MRLFKYLVIKEKSKANKKILKSLNEEQIKQREKLHNDERYEVKVDHLDDEFIESNKKDLVYNNN